MASLRLLLSGSLIFIATAFPINNTKNEANCFPDYIIPECYNINIIPYAKIDKNFQFLAQYVNKEKDGDNLILYGNSSININITETTRYITLYSSKSNIYLLSLKVYKRFPDEREIPKGNYRLFQDNTDYILRFFSVSGLEPGAYILKTEFFSNIFNDEGIFSKIFYENDEGIGWLIVADLQAIRSKYIFPCPYEPSKSNLVISLKSRTLYVVKSDIPELMVSHTFENDLWWTNIHISIMATHFVAFGRNDFSYATSSHGNAHMIFRRQLWAHMGYTWRIIKNVTTYLNNQLYTDNSNTSIVNHILLPDFSERNVAISGIVFHRETDIIYDNTFAHPARKIGMKRSITRNVVYGMLGNMPFWLKDGIAIHLFHKMYGPNDLFTIQNQHEFLHLNSNFSMEYFLKNRFSKINLLSSYPGYFKAPFTLRMMRHVVTDTIFQKVIDSYLKNALNFATDYFWNVTKNALKEANFHREDYNLVDRMKSWVKLKSCPVVMVTSDNDDSIYIKIGYYDLQNVDDLWIPVPFVSESNSKFGRNSPDKDNRVFWIQCVNHLPGSIIHFISGQHSGWMIANVQQTCPYRVNYDIKVWQKLTKYLNSPKFKRIYVLNRAQMIDDAFHLAMENKFNVSVFWNLTTYLRQEINYVPWYPMFKALESMSSVFPLPDERVTVIKDKINALLHRILMVLDYREKSVENTVENTYLRQEAARWACTLDLTNCTKTANLYLQQYFAQVKKHKLLPWWEEWTYCKGLIAANNKDWLKARNILLKTTKSNDNKIWEYLACPQNSTVIRKYLESLKTLSSDIETVYIFHSIIARHAKNDKVLDDILRLFSLIKPRRYSIIAAIVDIINHVFSQAQLDKVRILVEFIKTQHKKFFDQKIERRSSQIMIQIHYLQLLSN